MVLPLMAAFPVRTWHRIPCEASALRLDIVLPAGQSFRWRESSPGEWTSVLSGRVFTLKQDGDDVLYRVFDPALNRKESVSKKNANIGTESKRQSPYDSVLRDYFQLDIDIKSLYQQWSKIDSNFAKAAVNLCGLRTLRQDPVETLFAFICSSNNNIPRISGMVEKLCETYGTFLCELDEVKYFSFPKVEALAGSTVEQQLRQQGFGYRAKFVSQSARYILENHSEEWLYELRKAPYAEAHEGNVVTAKKLLQTHIAHYTHTVEPRYLKLSRLSKNSSR